MPYQTCENCRFFEDVSLKGKDDQTFCLRYPPQLEVGQDGYETIWLFPRVHKTNRCGEWRPILPSGVLYAYDDE